jgi:hypothetical protein
VKDDYNKLRTKNTNLEVLNLHISFQKKERFIKMLKNYRGKRNVWNIEKLLFKIVNRCIN